MQTVKYYNIHYHRDRFEGIYLGMEQPNDIEELRDGTLTYFTPRFMNWLCSLLGRYVKAAEYDG